MVNVLWFILLRYQSYVQLAIVLGKSAYQDSVLSQKTEN